MENDYKSNVARKNYERIDILVHGALSIPNNYIKLSKTYVKCLSKHSIKTNQPDNQINRTFSVEGINPVWNTNLTIETLEEDVQNEELIICISDETHRLQIAEFKIPWTILYPFYQYNLELIWSDPNRPIYKNEIKLYVSLYRRLNENHLSQTEQGVYGLEVLLNSINATLKEKKSMYAVARIVAQYENYESILARNLSKTFEFKRVNFPSPSILSYQPVDFYVKGYPQITAACTKSKQLIWKHNFWFATDEEKEALFKYNNKTALFIEFYYYENLAENTWLNLKLFGWTKMKFDEKRKQILMSDEMGLGYKSDLKLFEINESILVSKFTDNKVVETESRFAKNTQHLNRLINMTGINDQSSLAKRAESKANNSNQDEPTSRQVALESKVQTPKGQVLKQVIPVQAITNNKLNEVLPEPEIIRRVPTPPEPVITVKSQPKETVPEVANDFYDTYLSKPSQRAREVEKQTKEMNRNKLLSYRDDFSDIPPEYKYAFINLKQPNNNDIDGVLYYYYNLMTCYRGLVRKMDDDADELKKQVRTLEQINFQLTNKMANFAEKKLALLKMTEINEMDRISLNKQFLELRTKLAVKSEENLALQDKIVRLEKQLDRKRAIENEMEKVAHVHNAQNKDIEAMQLRLAQAYGLEDTVKRQELVIEKLENLIHKIVASGDSTYALAQMNEIENNTF